MNPFCAFHCNKQPLQNELQLRFSHTVVSIYQLIAMGFMGLLSIVGYKLGPVNEIATSSQTPTSLGLWMSIILCYQEFSDIPIAPPTRQPKDLEKTSWPQLHSLLNSDCLLLLIDMPHCKYVTLEISSHKGRSSFKLLKLAFLHQRVTHIHLYLCQVTSLFSVQLFTSTWAFVAWLGNRLSARLFAIMGQVCMHYNHEAVTH